MSVPRVALRRLYLCVFRSAARAETSYLSVFCTTSATGTRRRIESIYKSCRIARERRSNSFQIRLAIGLVYRNGASRSVQDRAKTRFHMQEPQKLFTNVLLTRSIFVLTSLYHIGFQNLICYEELVLAPL